MPKFLESMKRLSTFSASLAGADAVQGEVFIALREFELDFSTREPTDRNPGKLDPGVISTQLHSGKFLYIEVESITNLPIKDRNIITNLPDTFIVVKLGDTEVARTKTVYNSCNPHWYDECYEVPSIVYQESGGKSKVVTVEVWSVNTFMIGESLGVAKFTVDAAKFNEKQITTYSKKLVSDHKVIKPSFTIKANGSKDRVFDQLKQEGKIDEGGAAMQPNSPPGRQWNKLRNRIQASRSRSDFKVPNPNPTRRIQDPADKLQFSEFKSSKSTLVMALVIIVCYLFLGVISFSFVFEKSWSVRESLYFSVVTFTTVGYGDLYPTTEAGQIWCCFFALIGIGIIGYALSIISQNLVQMSINASTKSTRKKRDVDVTEIYDDNDSEEVKNEKIEAHAKKMQKIEDKENKEKRDKAIQKIVKSLYPIVVTVILGAFVVKNVEETYVLDENGQSVQDETGADVMRPWTWVESFYWCVITGASVGYGEFSLKTPTCQWFSIFFIPLSVGVIGAALGKIANIYVEREIEKANAKLLGRELTMEDLDNMNTDDDGEVSELEFIEFMLKTMKKVDQNLLDDLHASFKKMDADGSGSLQKEDLELLAKKKLDLSRKMKMLAYKNSLERSSRTTFSDRAGIYRAGGNKVANETTD